MTAKRSHPRIPILLRLEPEELALIDRAATTAGVARTDFIRDAVKARSALDDARTALEAISIGPLIVPEVYHGGTERAMARLARRAQDLAMAALARCGA